jgi:hypothetical protein
MIYKLRMINNLLGPYIFATAKFSIFFNIVTDIICIINVRRLIIIQ